MRSDSLRKCPCSFAPCSVKHGRGQLKCDGTRAETRFRLSVKWTSPFKLVGASVQSTTGSRGVRISGSIAGYTMFRGSVKDTGYPLHSRVSHRVPTHFHLESNCSRIDTDLNRHLNSLRGSIDCCWYRRKICEQRVAMCTTSLTLSNSTFCPHSVITCFVWIWEQTAIISLYSINWLVFINEECVYCAVRTEYTCNVY